MLERILPFSFEETNDLAPTKKRPRNPAPTENFTEPKNSGQSRWTTKAARYMYHTEAQEGVPHSTQLTHQH